MSLASLRLSPKKGYAPLNSSADPLPPQNGNTSWLENLFSCCPSSAVETPVAPSPSAANGHQDSPEFRSFQKFMEQACVQFNELEDAEKENLEKACLGIKQFILAWKSMDWESANLEDMQQRIAAIFPPCPRERLVQKMVTQKEDLDRLCQLQSTQKALLLLVALLFIVTIVLNIPALTLALPTAECVLVVMSAKFVFSPLTGLALASFIIKRAQGALLTDKIRDNSIKLLQKTIQEALFFSENENDAQALWETFMEFLHGKPGQTQTTLIEAGKHSTTDKPFLAWPKGRCDTALIGRRYLEDAQNIFLLHGLATLKRK